MESRVGKGGGSIVWKRGKLWVEEKVESQECEKGRSVDMEENWYELKVEENGEC